LEKAKKALQYDIENRALQMLLLVYLAKGDAQGVKNVLARADAQRADAHDSLCQEARDAVWSSYSFFTGRPDGFPSWAQSEHDDDAHQIPFAAGEIARLARTLYLYRAGDYKKVVARLRTVPADAEPRVLERIKRLVMEAMCLFMDGAREEALAPFYAAYQTAEPNALRFPFILYGRDMLKWIAYLEKRGDLAVPGEWLAEVKQQTSIFVKRTEFVVGHFAREDRAEGKVEISRRELCVLVDVAQGLTRQEIAAEQFISVNTVKSVLQIVYSKLGAKNNVDAVRIAREWGLLS
jgi:LuxR family maltose regulon positive regulatory protein